MKKIRVILLGAGNRGEVYATHMAKMPEQFQIVAVADPDPARRETIRKLWGFSENACYESWEAVLEQPKFADLVVIATMDNIHYYPALQAIDRGYHLLLEKPVAQTVQECVDIALAAEKKGVMVLVAHVLRYTPFFGKVKQLLMDGAVGEVMSIAQVEAIGNDHYGHSYVRGNWHCEAESTPILLAKCCHDLDMIQWLLGKPCKRVQSFGSLTHFVKENAPAGAPRRCADGGCPVGETCPYNCLEFYYKKPEHVALRKKITKGIAKGSIPTDDEVLESLRTTDFGLCVYQANNDVPDHQTVNMEFAGGATATLTMNAFNEGGRHIRVFGTKGELYAYLEGESITLFTFEGRETAVIPILDKGQTITGNHSGGDEGIVRELYEYLSGTYTGFRAADLMTSVKNHMIGFAAEEGRHSNTVVELDDYFARYGMKNEY